MFLPSFRSTTSEQGRHTSLTHSLTIATASFILILHLPVAKQLDRIRRIEQFEIGSDSLSTSVSQARRHHHQLHLDHLHHLKSQVSWSARYVPYVYFLYASFFFIAQQQQRLWLAFSGNNSIAFVVHDSCCVWHWHWHMHTSSVDETGTMEALLCHSSHKILGARNRWLAAQVSSSKATCETCNIHPTHTHGLRSTSSPCINDASLNSVSSEQSRAIAGVSVNLVPRSSRSRDALATGQTRAAWKIAQWAKLLPVSSSAYIPLRRPIRHRLWFRPRTSRAPESEHESATAKAGQGRAGQLQSSMIQLACRVAR